ncbi:hypothetical protein AHF37_00465 [Paragonimus kellicotti]|nr:hypothetical protein AHF37_00465 [Paragonimus kellicotti]
MPPDHNDAVDRIDQETIVQEEEEQLEIGFQESGGLPKPLTVCCNKIDLTHINGILAIVYTVTGVIILIVTSSVRSFNPITNGMKACRFGYCYTRAMVSSLTHPFYKHYQSGAFHPYEWSVALAAFTLILYGFLVWSKLSVCVINMGHILNWITFSCLAYTAAISTYHVNDPFFKDFTDPPWFAGMLHTIFGPVLFWILALCTLLQAVLNIRTLVVHNLDYYPEIAKFTIQQSEESPKTDVTI